MSEKLNGSQHMSEPELASSRLHNIRSAFRSSLIPFQPRKVLRRVLSAAETQRPVCSCSAPTGVGSDLQHMHGLLCAVPGCAVPCDLPIGRDVQGPTTRTAAKNVCATDGALRSPEWELREEPKGSSTPSLARANRAAQSLCSCSLGLFAGRANAAKRPPQKRKATERLPRLLRTMRLVTPKLP